MPINNIRKRLLAYAIGKDQQTLQRLEAGMNNPTYTSLMLIAEGLHVPVEELVKGL